ncbi:MAG: T9SS type A sorting domain-containing protein [Gelidibacter sp.]
MRHAITFFALILGNHLFAQDLYAFKGYTLYKIDESNSITTVFMLDQNGELGFNDITYVADDLFYAVISGEDIYEVIPSTSTTNVVGSFEGSAFPFGFNSLTFDGQNLYSLNGADGILYKYDLSTNTSSMVADLGFTSPGDCTFYKGHIIFLASEDYYIKAYNIATGNLLNVACIPFSYDEGYGLTNLFTSCDEEKIIISFGQNLYEIDFENNLLIETGIVLPNNFSIYGLASSNEHLAFNCESELEQNPCALSVAESEFLNATVFHPNPTHGKVYLHQNFQFDSMTLRDIRGVVVSFHRGLTREIDVSHLESGLYFACFVYGNNQRVEKLIKI